MIFYKCSERQIGQMFYPSPRRLPESPKRRLAMNDIKIKFEMLPPNKQEQLISFLIELLSYSRLIDADNRQGDCRAE